MTTAASTPEIEEKIAAYYRKLEEKLPIAQEQGFEPLSAPHESLKPHQVDICYWACRGGRRAIFAKFGLGKTRMNIQLAKWITEKTGGRYLIVAPLGVRQEFTKSDGPAMGVDIQYVRNDAEVAAATSQILITNYERMRSGEIDVNQFQGMGLDEAAVLRSYGSETFQELLKIGQRIPYRFVFTATPSPNRYKELIHYAGFLGIKDTGESLTRWFKRNPKKAGDLKLYPHMDEEFHLWLASWATFIQRPSDLGHSDEGYDLPGLQVHWHKIDVDHRQAWKQTDSWGQAQMFLEATSGLSELATEKRENMIRRIDKAKSIMKENRQKGRHWILWHDLEDERRLIEKMIPKAKTVYGTQDLELREDLIMDFSRGKYPILATKASLAGSGCNFQRHCADAIFIGVNYKFADFIQAIHRIFRFLQARTVNIHIVYTESEASVVAELKAKWKRHDQLCERMSAILRENKLKVDDMRLKLTRVMGCERQEVIGERFHLIRNDTIVESIRHTPANTWDMICTSIPFGNQYEYSPTYNDLGNNKDDEAFFEQMDFAIPEWLRIIKPGRIAAIHVKDRIFFGNVTGDGFPTCNEFSDKTVAAFKKHGWRFCGRITIDTDVVRENNQTYRLGWSENAKDATKMGCGQNEYVLLFRKVPTDTSNSYADTPVVKPKAEYSLARWQVDAGGTWKSSGDRFPSPEELVHLPLEQIKRLWKDWCSRHRYNYNEHVQIGESLDRFGKLPKEFTLFPPVSKNPMVWTDISRINTLNKEQNLNGREKHVCPLQLDIIERLIERFTNKGDHVHDPFMGIGSVGYQAIKMGRITSGNELCLEYWRHSVGYCEVAEAEMTMPSLFDMESLEVA